MINEQDKFNVLRKIDKTPTSSQRDTSGGTRIYLGKLNYCLKALKKKGWLKLEQL